MIKRHEKITTDLREKIHNGTYTPNTNLPPTEQLRAHYNASKDTLTRALEPLEAEGLIQPINGIGVRVRIRPPQRRLRRNTVISHDPATGYRFPAATPGEKWTPHGTPSVSWELPPHRITELLKTAEGEHVLRRRRVMSPAGEPPFSVTDTWLPRHVVDEVPQVAAADTGPGGFLRRLEEAGHGPIGWTQYARAGMPGVVEARLLGISPRMPVMVLVRPGVSARSGGVVEVTVSVCPADRIELVSDLVRGRSAEWPVDTEGVDRGEG